MMKKNKLKKVDAKKGFWYDTKKIILPSFGELSQKSVGMIFNIFMIGLFFLGTGELITLLIKLIY